MKNYTDVLKKYAVFDGRASRTEFWMFSLVNAAIAILIQIIGSMILGKDSALVVAVAGLYSLAIFIPSLAVNVRRLHDTGRSGWWMFIMFLPLIGMIVLLVFEVLDSEPGDNRFGPNPKGVSAPTAPATPAAPVA